MKAPKELVLIAAFPPPLVGQSLAADWLRQRLPAEGFSLSCLDLSEPLSGEALPKRLARLLGLAWALGEHCLKTRQSMVYLQLGHGQKALLRDLLYLSLAAVFRRPIIVHVHGSGFRQALDSLPKPLAWLQRRALKAVDTAIVLSQSLRAMFENLLPEGQIRIIHNAVDADFEAEARAFVRPERAADAGFHILFLSHLFKAKGYESLLWLAKRAQAESKAWFFHFAGAKIPNQGLDIEAFIAEEKLENCRWLGPVHGAEKAALYQRADVFVLPSTYEGQPISILEAMHYQLPLITTDVGGIPDIVEGGSEWGSYVELGDVDALYKALMRLAENPALCRQMGLANQSRAQALFSLDVHIAQMVEVLNSAYARRYPVAKAD